MQTEHAVPLLVHQTWKHTHLRWPLSACVESFKKWNPRWQHNLWTDTACETLIGDHLPDFLPTYLAYPKGILRADIFRVAVLYIQGGVYADLDMECLRPLDELISACDGGDWEVLLGRDHPCHERTHYYGRAMWLNAFMIARPRAKFFGYVLDALTRQVSSGYAKDDAVQATGPGLLTRIVELGNSDLKALGIREMPWRWVHPLPNVFVRFDERPQYRRLIRTRQWREGRQVQLLEDGDDFQRWGEPPFAAHYWWHSYIENCREVNMLLKHAPSLLQTDGEIVERRLNSLPEQLLNNCPQSLGEALCAMAERGGKSVVIDAGDDSSTLRELVQSAGPGLGWKVFTDPAHSNADLIVCGGVIRCDHTQLTLIAQRLNRRGLFAIISGVRESDDSNSNNIPNMRRLGSSPLIWETAPSGAEEVPKIIHLFVDSNRRDIGLIRDSWARMHQHPWKIHVWNIENVSAWIEQQVPEFVGTYFDYPTEAHRLLAGRLLVLAKIGGVAVSPGIVALRPMAELLSWKRLLLDVKREPSGSLGASDRVLASCPEHPFWRGLVEALELARHKTLDEAVGAQFLSERAKDCSQFLARSDWPTLVDPDVLVFRPSGNDCYRLAKARMWNALATLNPHSITLQFDTPQA